MDFHSYDTHYYSSPYSDMYFWHGPTVVPVPVGTTHDDAAAFFTILLIILIIGGAIWLGYAYYSRDNY